MSENEALGRVLKYRPSIIGMYSMYTMEEKTLSLARQLKSKCELLVAGGPLPTVYPERFLQVFDVAAIGEGEQTMLEITLALRNGGNLYKIDGIAYRNDTNRYGSKEENDVVRNPPRQLISNLDSIPFPARDLFDNEAYKGHYKVGFGNAVTSVMTSRGCPYSCDFCSKPVFGNTVRMRSSKNVVDEIEDVLSYGYDCIFFQDDCFTLDEQRVDRICDEILERGLKFKWKCLSRVDSIKSEVVSKMKNAGCEQIFFGIESGNNAILKIMKKQFTTEQARKAVEAAASSGVETGAFFILGYPGETNQTILDTIKFATSLPLDYLSFTLPYPIPGTGLYEKVKNDIKEQLYRAPRHSLIDHSLNFNSTFSERKLKFAIAKATVQFQVRKYLGNIIYYPIEKPFEIVTNQVFKFI
ncbi:MAG: anaerobic magnesium-protoporphyrin monomethyl ester cyclase [Thermoproteota archaeon]|nr:anaerobic magnesium-protoporphyrin monomethyl ester cyclase [Thermoproteota archaeon]